LQVTLEIGDANRNEIDDLLQRRLGIIERRDGPNGTHIEKPVVEIGDKALLNRLELETDRLGIGNDGLRLRTRLLRPRAATRRATVDRAPARAR
jgi:hypothetical protein